MKRSFLLSSETTALIDALFKGRQWLRVLRTPSPSAIEIIRQIATHGEIEAAPSLLVFATKGTATETECAASAVALLFASLSEDEFVHIDQSFRNFTWYSQNVPMGEAWARITPDDLETIGQRNTLADSLFGLASMHANGRVREKAVRMLSKSTNGAELPFLFLRLNDWVDVVANLAAAAIRKRMVPEMAGAIARNISFVQRLTSWARKDHLPLFNSLVELLAQPDCRIQLEKTLFATDAPNRKIIYGVLSTANDDNAKLAVIRALSDEAPGIRLWAIRAARRMLNKEALASAIDQAMTDRSSAVRTAATYALIEKFPENLSALLPPLLMASTPALRAIARYHLARISDIDLRAFYTGQLGAARNRDVEITILSLGEIGNIDDVSLLAKYLHDTRPRVCASAIRGLARMCGDDFVEEFTKVLLSRTGLVAREAMRALMPRANLIDQEKVWSVFCQPGEAKQRARLLRLLIFRVRHHYPLTSALPQNKSS